MPSANPVLPGFHAPSVQTLHNPYDYEYNKFHLVIVLRYMTQVILREIIHAGLT